jgi:hypothetical protein
MYLGWGGIRFRLTTAFDPRTLVLMFKFGAVRVLMSKEMHRCSTNRDSGGIWRRPATAWCGGWFGQTLAVKKLNIAAELASLSSAKPRTFDISWGNTRGSPVRLEAQSLHTEVGA